MGDLTTHTPFRAKLLKCTFNAFQAKVFYLENGNEGFAFWFDIKEMWIGNSDSFFCHCWILFMFDGRQGLELYLSNLGALIWQLYLLEKVEIISTIRCSSWCLVFQHVTLPMYCGTKCTLELCVILTQSPTFDHIRVCFPIHSALSLHTFLSKSHVQCWLQCIL